MPSLKNVCVTHGIVVAIKVKKLFHRFVDYVTVYSDGRVVFTFRNGAEVGTEI